MYYVYILRSQKRFQRLYIGLTRNIKARLAQHNRGESTYTKTYAPWVLEAYLGFGNKKVAESFEAYLKTSSGLAFLKKRLLPPL